MFPGGALAVQGTANQGKDGCGWRCVSILVEHPDPTSGGDDLDSGRKTDGISTLTGRSQKQANQLDSGRTLPPAEPIMPNRKSQLENLNWSFENLKSRISIGESQTEISNRESHFEISIRKSQLENPNWKNQMEISF